MSRPERAQMPSASDPVQQFRDAMAARDLIAPADLIADGTIHRCDTNDGPRGRGDGSYVLHLDGIAAGGFENWRDGRGWENWRADSDRSMTPEEREAFRVQIEMQTRARDADKVQRQDEARDRAARIWEDASSVGGHDYLTRKGVALCDGRISRDSVVIPLRDGLGVLRSLQFIKPDGTKRFLSGGRIDGCYFAIGQPSGVICIVEGFATGASVHAATGHAVAVAFNAGNLLPVARALREKYPADELILCADDDYLTEGNPGITKAKEAAQVVGGRLALPCFGDDRPDKATDFNDMAAHLGIDAVISAINAASRPDTEFAPSPQPPPDPEGEAGRRSQASTLVAFVEARATLFHDENGTVYAQDRTTMETRRLDGRQFRDWLVAHFYEAEAASPRDQALREALATLSGLGRHRGEVREVHIRIACADGAYYLDLAEDGKNRAVRIAAGGWEVIADPPVLFIRPETMRPLPLPVRGGRVDDLWKLVNVPENARLVVLAWLCECLRPDTPFPLLELLGEQGSAKSTTQTILRRLIDPNACDLRAAPKVTEDVFVSAGANWLVSYENISHLPAPMQDALCVLSTGGGYSKRKLYSDADESVITVKRPVILNGISAAVTAQDLIDRTMSIETPIIVERTESTEISKRFAETHGALLGALLDVMAMSLARLPHVRLDPKDRPRLAEFARLGMAVAEAVGRPGTDFLEQFMASRQEAIARTIDASPVATAVVAWAEQNPDGATDTASGFMARLEPLKPVRAESWPWSAKGLADALRRAAPALRQMGIECRSLPKTGGVIRWQIIPKGKSSKPCPASPACPGDEVAEQDIRTFRTSAPEVSSRWETEI